MAQVVINTSVKLGEGTLTAAALSGIISKYPIEHGTNYTKWSDGTMEQWGKHIQYASTGYNNAWGAMFHTPYVTWNFPIAFSAVPISVQVTAGVTYGGQGWGATERLATTTSAGSYYMVRPTAFTGTTNIQWEWHAIGRWK